MNRSRPTRSEAGNAVALTLLGLAVAILAGVVVLYYISKSTPHPVSMPEAREEAGEDLSLIEDRDPREGWRSYTNDEHEFSFRYPPGWIIATGTVYGVPVVTLYEATQIIATTSPFGVHEAEHRVSVYPLGLPAGGGGEVDVPSKTIVPVPQASARDRVLGTGKPYATTVHFDQYPESWSEAGFVFGRVPIEEEEVGYFRGSTGISPEEFDAYSGDTMKRFGFVDLRAWEELADMLTSFSFTHTTLTAQAVEPIENLIKVSSPKPATQVTSPLLVTGAARGSWYFEASFPVSLVTGDGEVLARVPATAQDEWMTEEFVSFEVSLVFASTSATSGAVILEKDNPSGLPEFARSLEIPVLFGE